MYKRQVFLKQRVLVAFLSALLLFTLPAGWSAAEANSNLEWEQNYGNIELIHVKETSEGYSLVGINKDNHFIYLAKTDANGHTNWDTSLELRGSNGKLIELISADSTIDGGYILGGAITSTTHWRYRDYFFAKIDADGSVEWTVEENAGAYGSINDIKQIYDGSYLYVSSMESLNVGFSSASVGKLISNHSIEWQTSLGSSGPRGPFISASNLEELGNDNYLVIGSIDNKPKVWRLDSTQTISWSNSYPNLSYVGDIAAEADGGYSIAGANAANEVVLIKNDANNNETFQQSLSFGGVLKSLVTTVDNGYYFGTADGLYKTDATGNVQWSQPVNNLTQVIATTDGGAAVIANGSLLKFNDGESVPGPESLHFDSSLYTLTVGQTLDTVVNARNGSTVTDVTYEANFSSDDDSIVSIDEFGNITGLQSGKTNIRATWNGKEAQATVIVFNIYTGLRLDDTEYSVNIGQPIDLVATYQEGDQFTNVTTSSSYSTSDPSIAIVDQEGSIIGLKRGQTTLTVTYNGVHATATIDVY